MKNSESNTQPHSAQFFGEYRDFWWNGDFLELMAKRANLSSVETALDVGCGVGHWGRLLHKILPNNCLITGVDREQKWVEAATQKAFELNLSPNFKYTLGNAESLPFDDNSFDLVTCQTVLIHLKDPKRGLSEMIRVAKPGGIVFVTEPNNFSNQTIFNSYSNQLSVDEVLDRLRFFLTLERGKEALGLGFNSIGDMIPGYLNELGLEDIHVFMSDKATGFWSPCSRPEEKANIQQMKDWCEQQFIGWEKSEAEEYFIAGGGSKSEFARYYKLLLDDTAFILKSILDKTYHTAGGAVSYVIFGRKPI